MTEESPAVYELTVDLPNLPAGHKVQIQYLGEFENGQTYEVTKDEADEFRAREPEHRTVLKAAKNMFGVTVKTAGKSKESDDNEDKSDEGPADNEGETQTEEGTQS